MSDHDPRTIDTGGVHPESLLRAPDGRIVQLKVHSANWERRLRLALDLGADVITTNTPCALATHAFPA